MVPGRPHSAQNGVSAFAEGRFGKGQSNIYSKEKDSVSLVIVLIVPLVASLLHTPEK